MKLALLALLLVACDGLPYLPSKLTVPRQEGYEAAADAVVDYAAQLNAQVGCELLVPTEAKAPIRIHWFASADELAAWDNLPPKGGYGALRWEAEWGPVVDTDGRVEIGLAADGYYGRSTADARGRMFLFFVGVLVGMRACPGAENTERGCWPHPTLAADPVGALMAEVGPELRRLCRR
jgi:hypothetical protein